MQTCWFIVIEVGDKWFVDCEGKGYGPFAGKDDAILEGTRLARTFGEDSRQSQLWVKDTAGQPPRRVWEGPAPRRLPPAPRPPAPASRHATPAPLHAAPAARSMPAAGSRATSGAPHRP